MKHANLLGTLAGLVLAGLLAAGCAEPDRGDGGSGAGGTTTSTTTTPTTSPSTTSTTRPSGAPGFVNVTGTVVKGVEPDCLLLDAEQGGPYLLVGGDRSKLRPGARVKVTGKVDRDLLSTCQQGEPLVVASIRRAP
jgi:hypothetical protein